MPAGLAAGDDEVRALAAEILAREDYAAFRVDPDVWLAPLRTLAGWLQALERLRFDDPWLYWLVMSGLLGLSLALLAHVVWTVSRALRMPAPEPARARERAGPGLLERAERLAEAGNFLEAARLVERATLEQLLQRRALRLTRSDPNRVLRRRLREAELPAREREELLGLLDRLERRVFREGTEDPELYRAWRALHGRVAALPGAV